MRTDTTDLAELGQAFNRPLQKGDGMECIVGTAAMYIYRIPQTGAGGQQQLGRGLHEGDEGNGTSYLGY